jgi:type I restriction enzyme S subunit
VGQFTESVVEQAALAWLESLGWSMKVKSRTLAALRDTLLPKLISGELWVKNAERIVRRIV